MVDELKRRVSTELALAIKGLPQVPDNDQFQEWAALCQNLWDRAQEYRHYEKLRGGGTSHISARIQHQSTTQPDTRQSVLTGDPMDLSAGRLVVSNAECRARQLCFYFKEPGHAIDDCPKKQAVNARSSGARPYPQVQSRERSPVRQTRGSVFQPHQRQLHQQPPRWNQSQWQYRGGPQHLRQTDLGGFIAGEIANGTGHASATNAQPTQLSGNVKPLS